MGYFLTAGLLLPGLLLFAQLNDQQHQILEGINAYRTELFNKNTVDRRLLGAVIEKQRQQEISSELLTDLIMKLGVIQAQYDRTQKVEASWITQQVHENPIYLNMTDAEVEIILRNSDMYDLMHEGILSTTYPYIVTPNSKIYDELGFYHIQDGQRIAEVGAGNGEFAIILGVIYHNLELYINEIQPDKIDYINRKITKVKSLRPGTSLYTVHGSIYNPNLPLASFDKIILRRALHHFNYPKSMLKHIAASLKTEGELLIFENPHRNKEPRQCSFSLMHEQIIREVERRYFKLVDTWQNDNATYYRFRKRN